MKISPDEIIAAYQHCNIKCRQGAYFQYERILVNHPKSQLQYKDILDCACPLGALYLYHLHQGKIWPVLEFQQQPDYQPSHEDARIWAIEKYGVSFVGGFISGFDRPCGNYQKSINHSDEFLEGLEDGLAVNKQCVVAGILRTS